jgi:hypothetical protein
MAPINMFGRADFLTPLEIPGAATPQPILLTTIWILITRRSRGATGSAGAQRGGSGFNGVHRGTTGQCEPRRAVA